MYKHVDDIIFPCGFTLPQLREMDIATANMYMLYDRVAFGAFFFCNPTPDGRRGLIDLKYYLDGIPQYHIDISNMLNRMPQIKRGAIIAPRNSSKTALVTRLGVMHEIVYRKLYNILIGTEDDDMGIEYLEWTKDELEQNPLIVKHFGNFKPKKKYDGKTKAWRSDCIVTEFNQKLFSRSMGKRVRGSNFLVDRIQAAFVDDPESDRNTRTNKQMKKNRDWLNKEIIFSLTSDGWVVVTGNFVTSGCITVKLDRSKFWQSIKISAMNEGLTKSFWESRRPAKKLLEEKERLESMGDYTTFWIEYMNDIRKGVQKRFDSDEYRFWYGDVYSEETQYLVINKTGEYYPGTDEINWKEEYDEKVPVSFFLGIDLAFTEEEQNDFNAFSVNAIDKNNNIYDIEKETLKTTRTSDILEWIINKYIYYRFRLVSIESISAQRLVVRNLREEIDKQLRENKNNYELCDLLGQLQGRIKEVPYHNDSKTQRILGSLQPKQHNGKILFRCKKMIGSDLLAPMFPQLVEQYDYFPELEHDDLIDADEICISNMNTNNVPNNPYGITKPIIVHKYNEPTISESWITR